MNVAVKPAPTSRAFLEHAVSNSTQYSEGWRQICQELLDARDRIAELEAFLNKEPSPPTNTHADRLRSITGDKQKAQEAQRAHDVQDEIRRILSVCEQAAHKGDSETTWRHRISKEALKHLKTECGLKILDQGEDVADLFLISWKNAG